MNIHTNIMSPKCLDSLHFGLLYNLTSPRRSLLSIHHTNFLYTLLLLLAGDINLNHGPTDFSSSSIYFALLNIRFASSISTDLNKPEALHNFISNHHLDIILLTETCLKSDCIHFTRNSFTPLVFLSSTHPDFMELVAVLLLSIAPH